MVFRDADAVDKADGRFAVLFVQPQAAPHHLGVERRVLGRARQQDRADHGQVSAFGEDTEVDEAGDCSRRELLDDAAAF